MKKILMLLYQCFIFTPILLLATIFTATVVMIGCTFGDNKFWGYVPPRYWSKLACRLALCKVTVKGSEKLSPNQSYVITPNHQGAFDIFLIYGYLGKNLKWVQKHTLRKIPFVGKASEIAGHIFVNQSSLKSMKETIINAEKAIQDGVSMVIFPEGSRSYDGKMIPFRKGAFLIAQQMQLPIVPVTLNGPFDVMKIHTYFINPGKLELIIHDPIPTNGLKEDQIPALVSECYNAVHSSLWDRNK